MTVGQRIALKRKELGLSQEALGERLGVSRQAIYKWESDAALPEVEKLVKLGREFSVPVGWLLGEEDDAPEKPELTPEQLRMVEEIVGRYLDARPKPEPQREAPAELEEDAPVQPKKRRRWPYVLAAVGVVVLLSKLTSLVTQVDSLRKESHALQSAIYDIQTNVNSQINGIANRVEDVLQSQNALTAEQSAAVSSTDYRANTVTIFARALPRTYVEGMTAEFILVSDGETVTVPGELGDDHAFAADVTGPLSDDISVSVVFLSGDQRETQLLNQFSDLYTGSFPELLPDGNLWGHGTKIEEYIYVDPERRFDDNSTAIESIRVGLFRDRKLLAWYERTEKPDNYYGDVFERSWFFRLDGEWTMEPDHVYEQVTIITDEYGRERAYPAEAVRYSEETNRAEYYDDGQLAGTLNGCDPSYWEY